MLSHISNAAYANVVDQLVNTHRTEINVCVESWKLYIDFGRDGLIAHIHCYIGGEKKIAHCCMHC